MHNAQHAEDTRVTEGIEQLTGHTVRVIHSHRRPPAFEFEIRKSIGWLAALGIVATLLSASASSLPEPASQPFSAAAVLSLPATPEGSAALLSEPPPIVQRPGPDIAIAVRVTLKPRPVPATPVNAAPAVPQQASLTRVQVVISYALAQRGKPYRWNAAGPNSFDCSGLVLAAYARIGIHMYHYTGAMLKLGHRVSRGAMQPGDLVFPSSSHVGIYLGNNQMVVAPHSGSVVKVQTVYAFYAAVRIL